MAYSESMAVPPIGEVLFCIAPRTGGQGSRFVRRLRDMAGGEDHCYEKAKNKSEFALVLEEACRMQMNQNDGERQESYGQQEAQANESGAQGSLFTPLQALAADELVCIPV